MAAWIKMSLGMEQCDLSYGFLVKVTVKVSRYNIFQLQLQL